MKPALLPLMRLGILAFAYLYATSDLANAQVTPDGTVNTQVNQTDNVSEITGGETRGDNLFHSFQEFSVRTGNEAFFNNADAIKNIFSRVTGGNASTIDGLIRANGSASLFLINPAGIIFGEGARLDLGGSFYGSSADSILFDDGEFSATDLDNPPVLTVNAPIGLGFRDNPEDIANSSVANDGNGLEVAPGNNLTLLGGDVSFNGGAITAPAGRVELGGLSAAGTISFNNDGSLSFPEGIGRGNVFFNQGAFVGLSGTEGGNLTVNANNLEISGNSLLQGGTFASTGIADGQSGDIILDATGKVAINASTIDNLVEIGNAGNIKIDTQGSIGISNSLITAGNTGTGLAGDIELDAPEEISIQNSQISAQGDFGRIFIGNSTQPSQVTLEGERTATEDNSKFQFSKVTLEGERTATEDNSKFQFSNLLSTTNSNLDDVAGTININARDNINVIGSDIQNSTATTRLSVDPENPDSEVNFSQVALKVDGENPAGTITIDQSRINTTNSNIGFAGDIILNAREKIAVLDTSIFSTGLSGRIFLTSSNDLVDIKDSFITTEGDNALSDSDQFSLIKITAPQGSIGINNSFITAENTGTGFAGDIILNAREKIAVLDNSSIFSRGSSGGILIGKSDISGETSSPQEVNFNNSLLTVSNASVTAPETKDQQIDAGDISINAVDNISFVDGSEISTVTQRLGNAGELTVQSESGSVFLDKSNVFSNVNPGGNGDAGNIEITASGSISFTNGAELQSGIVANKPDDGFPDSTPSGQGDGGDITLNATESITLSDSNAEDNDDGSGIFADVEETASGDGGNIYINIPTGSLSLTDKAILTAESSGFGNPGNIIVNAESLTLDNNSSIFASNTLSTDSPANLEGNNIDNIDLNIADRLILRNNSTISAEARGNATGGNIDIDAGFVIAFPGSDNNIIANAEEGQGGDIDITAKGVFGIEERPQNDSTNDIDASSELSLDGTVSITILEPDTIRGTTELPRNVIEPQQTSEQACSVNPETGEANGLTVKGKGGVPPAPDLPLNSQTIMVNGQDTETQTNQAQYQEIKPIHTSYGDIIPAQGAIVMEDGRVILTAYRTDGNSRVPQGSANCGK